MWTRPEFLIGLAAGASLMLLPLLVLRWRRQEPSQAEKKGLLLISHKEFERNLELVITDLAQLCKEQPSLTQPYLILGNLYRLSGEVQRSIVIHQNLMTEAKLPKATQDRVRIELACDLAELGLEDQAIPRLEEVSERSPLFVMAQEKLAELHHKHQAFDKAFACMDRIFQQRKSWRAQKRGAYYLALQGEKMLQGGDLPSAHRMVERTLAYDDECLLGLFLQGQLALEDKEYDRAIDSFTRLLQINPDFAFLAAPKIEDAYYGKQSFMRLGESLQALSQSFPTNPFLAFSLGKFLRKKKSFQEARRHLKNTLELNPTYLPAREELLNLNQEESQPETSVQDYQEFLHEIRATKHYVCTYCHTRHVDMTWHCSSCGRWESVQADLTLQPTVIDENPPIQHQASHS